MNDHSMENGGKLDKLIQLVEGSGEDSPGIVSRLRSVEVIINGKDGDAGLIHKVALMWRVHIWILCICSTGIGFGLRELIKKIWGI